MNSLSISFGASFSNSNYGLTLTTNPTSKRKLFPLAFKSEIALKYFFLHRSTIQNIHTTFSEFSELFVNSCPLNSEPLSTLAVIRTPPDPHESSSQYILDLWFHITIHNTTFSDAELILEILPNLPPLLRYFFEARGVPSTFPELITLVRYFEGSKLFSHSLSTSCKAERPRNCSHCGRTGHRRRNCWNLR